MTVSLLLSRRLTTKHLGCSVVSIFWKLVVSLHYADNCGGPFTSRLSDVNQPVIGPRIKFSLIPLSLSRLNHGQPGVQAHPEIVQGTADLHHEIADALLPQPDPVFHNATTLHTAIDMLDPEPSTVQGLVGPLLLLCQLLSSWLLGRHEDLDPGQRERQEAQILQQPAPGG